MALLVGSGHASPGRAVDHTCTPTDKQFVSTVASAMQQLDYWSRQLSSNQVTSDDVISQARSASQQVEQTNPSDPSLRTSRSLLGKMFHEYALAVKAQADGGDAGKHMGVAYELANYVHQVLADAQPGLLGKGCDLASILDG